MKKKTIKLICLVLAFTVICGVAFTGCRRSDVLERKIYTDNKNVDKNNQTKINNNDQNNQDQDNNITSKKETDNAKTQRNQQETKAQDGNGNSSDSTANKKYSAGASANGTADNSGNGTQKGTDVKTEGVTNTTGTTPGSGGNKQTVNDKGKSITIPETSDKVAAVGGTAAIVEMLGGTGKLKASSQNYVNNSIAKSVFPDVGSTVQALWDGNGTSQISDANFATLRNLLKSDSSGSGAVLYDSGMLTSAQVSTLNGDGIKTYPMGLATNSPDSYKEQVTAIGKILGGDAVDKAKQYCDWYDSVLSKAKAKASSDKKYTLFVQAWDPAAGWSVADRSGTGLGIAPSRKFLVLFDQYLNTVNVVNSVTVTSGELGQARNWYVNPLYGNGAYAVSLNGTVGEILKDDPLNKLTSISGNTFLGTSAFPGVITGSSAVTQALNGDKNSGSGLWTNYGSITVGNSSAHGFQVGDSIVQTTIYGDYSVNTLPSGIGGSWALGTPEGVLTAMWAANKFNNGGLDISGELKSFYSTFCGKNLSDGQINNILNGQ